MEEVDEYQRKWYLHPLFNFSVFYLRYFSTFPVGILSLEQMAAKFSRIPVGILLTKEGTKEIPQT